MKILLAAVLACAVADDVEIVRPLEAKGVKVKKSASGVVTELHMGGIREITIEDYKAVGQCRSLVSLNLSAEDRRFDDEAAAQLTGLEKLEKFFSNGAQLTDDGFKPLASWKSLKQIG